MFSAKAKVCGIIGNPIEHSLSPLLHRTLSLEAGKDMAYVPLKVENNLEAAIEGAYALGFFGLNVTIPYKQEVMKYLEDIDELAKDIGAVNTLVRYKRGFKGYNTDLPGLKKSLDESGIGLKGKDIVILGAGGAAKAVIYLCITNGIKSLNIFNRSVEKAVCLIEEIISVLCKTKDAGILKRDEEHKKICFLYEGEQIEISCHELESLNRKEGIEACLKADKYIAFQTSSVGMFPEVSACIVENEKFYDKCEAGVDLIYTPLETVFLSNFSKRNKKGISGLDMLINQGILAWELWNDAKISAETALKAKKEVLKELNKVKR